jgi:hypothetical protein
MDRAFIEDISTGRKYEYFVLTRHFLDFNVSSRHGIEVMMYLAITDRVFSLWPLMFPEFLNQ